MSDPVIEGGPDQIAVIGMACRFPGAKNVEAFWQNLCNGVESISFFSEHELLASGVERTLLRDPHYIRAGSVLEDIDLFDAPFFNFSPRQAELTDPQHRLFLECAWEALESAGYDPAAYAGLIGIFAGSNLSNYLLFNVYPALGYTRLLGNLQTLIGNDKDYLATHVSYKLNLKGPSVNVQTACSTSLVAVHLACQSLLNRECDMALAGGVAVRVPHKAGYLYQDSSIFSPDGHCRPFDAQAGGTIFGNGMGLVVLKRLTDARAEGDRIEAIIRGSAINNDGSVKVGYTAPGEDGQAEVIAEALAMAQVDPATITFLETHGTGTPLGDPIEVAALTRAFRAKTKAKGFCALGAVKSNLGHLESAAGIAGLIKTVLALQHKQLPPTLHFERPNPQINFADTPFYVNDQLAEWKASGAPRRAGVSSFGIGGTNAHVILEEAPSPQPSIQDDQRAYLLPLSARSPEGVRDLARAYCKFLTKEDSGGAHRLYDICYTASQRRRHYDHRWAVAGHTHQELVERLEAFLNGEVPVKRTNEDANADSSRRDPHQIAFVFSGQGSQWTGMGQQLLRQEPIFHETLRECDELFRQFSQGSLSLIKELTADPAQSRLDETEIAQPAIFAIQIALAALWRSWGIVPDSVVGHSVGEVAAAHVAGVLSLQQAAKVVYHRGRLMQPAAGKGRMATVGLSAPEVERLLTAHAFAGRLVIAAMNGPTSTVVLGEPAALDEFLQILERQGVFSRLLRVNYAFHSPQMEPFQEAMVETVRGLAPQRASVRIVSTVTGRVSNGPDFDAAYWGRNIREPVRFSSATQQLLESGHDVFIEMSPHPVLRPAIEESLSSLSHSGTVVHSLRRGADEPTTMLESLGMLYGLGQSVNWDKVYPARGLCLRLPSYPWQRQRYWLEPTSGKRAALGSGSEGSEPALHPLLGRRFHSAIKEIVFESQVNAASLPYLSDHRLGGEVLFPGTAYLEMAQAAAAAAWGSKSYTAENVCFHERLVLGEGEQAVQLVLTPDDSGGGGFQLFSQATEGESWRLHASGSLRVAPDAAISRDGGFRPEEIQACCTETLSGEAYYERLREHGFEYGPSFRGVEQLWRGDGGVLGLVRLPKTLARDNGLDTIHPALLDACLHIFGAAVSTEDRRETYLPTSIESFQVFASPGDCLWSHLCLRPNNGPNQTSQTGDVSLFNTDGGLVARVMGFRVTRIHRTTLPESNADTVDDWLYRLQWQPHARATVAPRLNVSGDGPWLIFADQVGVGQALARLLEERGETCTLVFSGEKVAAENRLCLGPARLEDFEHLMARTDKPYRRMVHLWGLDAAPSETATADSLLREQERVCGSILYLLQALAKMEWESSPRLWLVTRGAQTTGAETVPPCVSQASLWGLGRVLALEHPDLSCVRLDLDPTGGADETRHLLDEILAPDEEDEIAWRQEVRYTPRLVRAAAGPVSGLTTPEEQPFRLAIPVRGVIDNLTIEPVTRRSPGPGEVEIEVRATGLNFRDVLFAEGLGIPDTLTELNMYPGETGALGLECAGTIDAVGEGVNDLRVGDQVVAFAVGAFRSHVTAPASLVALKPERLGFEEAATIPVAFLTAWAAGGPTTSAVEEVGVPTIPMSQTPKSLMECIESSLNSYSTAFVKASLDRRDHQEDPVQIGSGTFVSVGKVHGILTAQHVARELQGNCALGLALIRHEHTYQIERQHLVVIDVACATCPADGPDLAFIVLPATRVGGIKAVKSFYNLDYDRDEMLSNPPALDRGNWFLCGAPGAKAGRETSGIGNAGVLSFGGMCYATDASRQFEKEGYDYIEVDVEYNEGTDALPTFGGMSGGGLWQVPIRQLDRGELEPIRFLLSGVIFYESAKVDQRRFIRCHGRRSIYRDVYNAVEQRTRG